MRLHLNSIRAALRDWERQLCLRDPCGIVRNFELGVNIQLKKELDMAPFSKQFKVADHHFTGWGPVQLRGSSVKEKKEYEDPS